MVTDVTMAREESRAVDLVERLLTAHGVGLSEPLRDLIESEPETTRDVVLTALGYIPADPAAWVRLKVAEAQFPTGMPGGGEGW